MAKDNVKEAREELSCGYTVDYAEGELDAYEEILHLLKKGYLKDRTEVKQVSVVENIGEKFLEGLDRELSNLSLIPNRDRYEDGVLDGIELTRKLIINLIENRGTTSNG